MEDGEAESEENRLVGASRVKCKLDVDEPRRRVSFRFYSHVFEAWIEVAGY